MAMLTDRGHVQGHAALELGAKHAGWLFGIDGRTSAPDIAFRCGTGMSTDFYDWIKDAFDRQCPSKSGAVVVSNSSFKQIARAPWERGLLAEVSLPALDIYSNDPAELRARIKPEEPKAPGPQAMSPQPLSQAPLCGVMKPLQPPVRKNWLSNGFSLQIAGLEDACRRITAVEAITLRVRPCNPFDVRATPFKERSEEVDLPDLVITLPEAFAGPFSDWLESGAFEKKGTLSYLSADGKAELFRLDFSGLVAFRLAVDKTGPTLGLSRRVKVEMACEPLAFSYTNAAL
jgi:hypothetical protein